MSRKTAWILDQYAVTPGESGIIRQFEHAELLAAHGWDVRVIASPFNHKTHNMDRPVSLGKRRLDIQEGPVDFSWVYSTPYSRNDFRRYINMMSFLLTSQIRVPESDQPGIVVGSSPHLLTGLAAWVISKRFNIPFVFEVRDLWPESLVQLGLSNPAIIRPLQTLEKFLYSRADAIVALTEGIGGDIRSRISNPDKVHVLPNAVRKPTRIPEEHRSLVRNRMGWSESETIAVYAGAHGDANDLGQVVEAAREINGSNGVRFVLIGDGPTKAALKNQARGLDNITFVDAMPKSEIGEILQSADIGLLTLKPIPLFDGARPNKLFDYMGASLPIVSTVKGEAERVLTASRSGIAVGPEELGSRVLQLAQDPDTRNQMAESGFRHASTVQTREDVVQEFATMLDSLIEAR